jgi:hypothetical protein
VGSTADSWRAARIRVDVSERTVSQLWEQHPRPPSQTWRTFLTNHLASAASMDFFPVPTLTGRVLFVVVLLSHHRRRILDVNMECLCRAPGAFELDGITGCRPSGRAGDKCPSQEPARRGF